MFGFLKNEFTLAKSNEQFAISKELEYLRDLIKDLIRDKFSSSFKVYIVDAGSCNGCELELQLLFSPLYDLASFGIHVTYDVSEADLLIVIGLMTENMHAELVDVYRKMKEPKHVLLVGDCPVFSAPFKNTFALRGQTVDLFSKSFHIPACPPEPSLLLEGVHNLLKKI